MFGLRKTLSSLFNRQKIDEEWYESLEEALLLGDVGMKATQNLIAQLKIDAKKQQAQTVEELKDSPLTIWFARAKPTAVPPRLPSLCHASAALAADFMPSVGLNPSSAILSPND